MPDITYKQGTNFYDPNTGKAVGIVNYDPNTGQKLSAGQSVVQSVPASALGNTMPLTLPQAPTGQMASPLGDAINSVVNSAASNQEKITAGNANDKMAELIGKLGTYGTATEQALAPFQAQKERVNKLEGEILKADEAHRRNLEAIMGSGTRENAQPAASEAQRLYEIRNADRAIAYHLANQDYRSAVETAEKKVEAEFQGYRDQLSALNTVITQNKQLGDREIMALEDYYAKGLISYRSGIENGQYLERAKIEAAQKNPELASRISGAKSLEDLANIYAGMTNSAGLPSAKIEGLQGTVSLINQIKNSNGLNSRVGPNSITRRLFAFGDAFGAGQAFAGSVHQLTSKATLDQLLALKAAGGTLGALSDQERIMLQNAATKLNAWEVKDKNGVGKGTWDITQKEFIKELDRLTELTNIAIQRAGGFTGLQQDDYQQIQQLYGGSAGFNAANYYQ